MPRKADPMRSLRAKLQHAQRDAKAARELSSALTTQFAEQSVKLTEAERERDINERSYHRVAVERTALKEERDEQQKRIAKLTDDLQSCRMALRGVETDRDRARAQAEAMRFQAFPTPPTFEWERARTAEELNRFDPLTFTRRL